MPDILSPDDIRLQRIQSLRQIGMPNAAPYQPPPIAPDAFGAKLLGDDGESKLQPVSQPQLQKIGLDNSPVKPLNFHQREALPLTSPDAPAGSISANQSRLSKLADERANPWGSTENHPGTLGKVGHILATVGNIAGDVLAPGVMQNIPGTDLNKRAQEGALQSEIQGQKAEQSKENVAEENAQSEAGLRGAQAEDLQTVPFKLSDGTEIPVRQKDVAMLQKEIEAGKTKENVAETTGQVKKDVAAGQNESKQIIGAGHDTSHEKIAGEQIASHEKIAEETNHNRAAIAAANRELQQWKTTQAGGKVAPLVGKAYDAYEDSVSRLNIMNENYEKALKGDQQAMLSILTNHIGMTLGQQKGARITQAILKEAEESAPVLGRIESRFNENGILSGVTLTPEQMKAMVDLGVGRLAQDHRKFQDMQTFYGGAQGNPQGSQTQPKWNPKTGRYEQ